MLIPLRKCMGADFGNIKRKPVQYKMQDFMMMDWTLDACQRLAKVGCYIESPALEDYKFSGRFQPYEHQRETFDFALVNPRSFIFDQIGTGKTLSSLWAADYAMKLGLVRKVLITSTLSTLWRVWESEIFHNFMHRSCVVLHGSAAKRRKLISEDYDFYIINHEGLKLLAPEIQKRQDIDLIICDEGARFRNQKTDLWKSMNLIGNVDTGRWLWWMTGSPMPKAPTDAWAQAKVVNPGTVPKYFTRFREQTMYKLNMFKWVPRKGWEDTVYSSLKPSILHKRDDCLDLPECMFVDHEVKMSKPQLAAYNSLKDNFIAELKDGLITASNEGVKLGKMLQIASGASYMDNKEVSYVDCIYKLKELDGIIEEVGDKLIIFVAFKHSIKVLERWLTVSRTALSYGIINGDVGTTKRNKIFDEFQNGDLNLIIAHPAAMAHGLTLTASNTICWWGPVDDYEIYEQAIGRITRPGQKRMQYIKHLICSPVEKAVYKRLKNKESMQGILLDMIKK